MRDFFPCAVLFLALSQLPVLPYTKAGKAEQSGK